MGEEDAAGVGSKGAFSAACANTLRLMRQRIVVHIVSLMIIVGSAYNERGALCWIEVNEVYGNMQGLYAEL